MTQEEILKLINQAAVEEWTELKLTGKDLVELPSEIGQLNCLNSLDLSGNKLTNLPSAIGQLTNLTSLYVSYNKLALVPKEIFQLPNLNFLDLSGNQLTSVPQEIGQLTSLTTLDLYGNKLTTLPSEIGQLTNLTILALGSNILSIIPPEIGKLTNLTTLYLNGTKLTSIPPELGQLSNLRMLSLSHNLLISLPPEICQMANLTSLYLRNNPIQTPPPEILNLDKDGKVDLVKMRRYFQQLVEVGKDRLFEAKLLIVGEPGAGKTSLARKLLRPTASLPMPEESTEGIEVHSWTFPFLKRDKGIVNRQSSIEKLKFRVNIWDFGGQEIYHATHQFFLTHRSLYILVADAREQKTDFDYWLHAVKSLSGSSPLLIVVNEKEGRQWHIDSGRLHKQFGNLAATCTVDLKINRGLPNLIDTVQRHIAQLPHVGDTLPQTWVDVRHALENDPRPHIPLQTFLDICQKNGFTRLDDKLQLSGYLHDLGVCLHFQDDDILKHTIILDPEWGTDAVYRVLDNKQVINNQGHFSREDLETIWNEEAYELMRSDLLALMMKFQLCYEIPHRPHHYIAPQLLSPRSPVYDWPEKNNLILRYRAPDFMPKGIIARFIVVMHRYIEEQRVWRDGVILTQDQSRAEVIEIYNKREICIRITGENKRDLLNAIVWEFDKIFNSFHELNYQQLIPCNCTLCKGSQSPHFYEMESLKRRLAKGQDIIECYESYIMVEVRSLIDDVIGNKNEKDVLSTAFNRLVTQFNGAELRLCCFELGVEYDDLGGINRVEKARELMTYLQRRNRLSELIVYMDRERP